MANRTTLLATLALAFAVGTPAHAALWTGGGAPDLRWAKTGNWDNGEVNGGYEARFFDNTGTAAAAGTVTSQIDESDPYPLTYALTFSNTTGNYHTLQLRTGPPGVNAYTNVRALTVNHNVAGTTHVTMQSDPLAAGGATFATPGSNGTEDFLLGRRTVGGAGNYHGILDLSGADQVGIRFDEILLGTTTTGGNAETAQGELYLAPRSDIHANTMTLGDSPASSQGGLTNRLQLGQITNGIWVNTVTIGGRKSEALVDIRAGGKLYLKSNTYDRADLRLGYNNLNTGTRAFGEMDLTGGIYFKALLDELVIGHKSGGGGGRGVGRLTLADDNEIDATTIMIGNSDDGGQTDGSDQCWLKLGATNTIAVDTFTVGNKKSNALVEFAAPGGELALEGSAGARADLRIGRNDVNTGATALGVVDLSGGVVTAMLDDLQVGQRTRGSLSGSGTGILTIGSDAANSVDVNNVVLGQLDGSGSGTASGTININGGTFTVNGSVADGGGSSTINLNHGTMAVANGLAVDDLRVGTDLGNATLTVGGGAVSIGDGGGTLEVGRRDQALAGTTTGRLDLGAATGVTIDVSSVRVGTIASVAEEGWAQGFLTLSQAGNNTITADLLDVGESPDRGNTSNTSELHLGGALNTINANTVGFGRNKGRGSVDIVPGGTLTIQGRAGAGTEADLYIGYNVTSTGTQGFGQLDLTDCTFNATLDELRIGRHHSGSSSTGILTMDAGTVTANNIVLADGANSTGILNLNGGTLIAGAISQGGGNAQFNWSGGTLTVGTLGFSLTQDVAGTVFAPGQSPGLTTIAGDYALTAGSLEIEMNGTEQGDLDGDDIGYDFVDISGTATLDSTLQILLLDGFLPATWGAFDVLTATSITLGDGFLLEQPVGFWPHFFEATVVPGGNGEILRLTAAVPEPGTLALLALGGIGALRRRRRRS